MVFEFYLLQSLRYKALLKTKNMKTQLVSDYFSNWFKYAGGIQFL